ncbi:MAG: PilZ domain-containing protein [Thermodesulfobacteriota bacterium]
MKNRAHPRLLFQASIEVRLLSEESSDSRQEVRECWSRDLSAGGLSFADSRPHRLDNVLRITVSFGAPGDSSQESGQDEFHAMAKVVWCSKFETDSYAVGVEFLNIYEEDFQFLRDYVLQKLEKGT